MLVLFETPAGYSLFKVSDERKLNETDPSDIADEFFPDSNAALQTMQLVNFQAFEDTADAVSSTTAMIEGKVSTTLKKFLVQQKTQVKGNLAVADKALAGPLKELLHDNEDRLKIVHNSKTQELFRGIRCYLDDYLEQSGDDDTGIGISPSDLHAMQLGLSHSLSRYKLKFSADKVDTMVIQAVGLLDELDKEINTYAMRVKEWYGWHFPELQALAENNAIYSQLVLKCGFRPNYRTTDLSDIIQDANQEAAIKEAAEISMGTEIADLDILNIQSLAEQVLSMTEYRAQLYEYLKNRMNAIAPNLTILVGELVGARLIAHAGSLLNLAKQPASTIQILGAEKALFRALKTKHDTPKYGLIYHASLVGQAAPKNKGKISRVLAAKAALGIRVDAFSDDFAAAADEDDEATTLDTTVGLEGRAKVEARLRQLEGGGAAGSNIVKNGGSDLLSQKKTAKYDAVAAKMAAAAPEYNPASDMVLDTATTKPAAAASDDKEEDEATNGGQEEEAAAAGASKKKKAKKEKKTEESAKKAAKKEKKKRKSEAVDGDKDEERRAKKAKKEKKKRKSKD